LIGGEIKDPSAGSLFIDIKFQQFDMVS